MAELDKIVNIVISRQTTAPEQTPFANGLFVSKHKVFNERLKFYASAAALITDGFSESSEAYKAAVAAFSQNPRPSTFAIGRVQCDDAEITVATLTNSALYSVTINGTRFDFTSDSNATVKEIVEGLAAAINTGFAITAVSTTLKRFTVSGDKTANFAAGNPITVSGSTGNDGAYTIASVTLDSGNTLIVVEEAVPNATADGAILQPVTASEDDTTLTIEPDVESAAFTVAVSAKLTLGALTASETITEALTAIRTYSDAWYWFAIENRGDADVQAAAAFSESSELLFGTSSSTAAIRNTSESADTTTIAALLRASNYLRTYVRWSSTPEKYPEIATLAAVMQFDPGSYTVEFKAPAGATIDAFEPTQQTNLDAKNVIYYLRRKGQPNLANTKAIGNEWLDIVIFLDWFKDRSQTRVFGVFSRSLKVPFTNAGIAQVEAELRGAIAEGVTAGGIDPASVVVTVPDALDIPADVRAARRLTGITAEFRLAGAIHSTQVNVTVTV